MGASVALRKQSRRRMSTKTKRSFPAPQKKRSYRCRRYFSQPVRTRGAGHVTIAAGDSHGRPSTWRGLLGVSPLHDLENIGRDLLRANQHERHPVPRPARRSAKPEAVDRGVLRTRPEQRQLIQPVRQAKHCAPSQVIPGAGRIGTKAVTLVLSGDGGWCACVWKLQTGNAVMFDIRQCRINPFLPKPFSSLCA